MKPHDSEDPALFDRIRKLEKRADDLEAAAAASSAKVAALEADNTRLTSITTEQGNKIRELEGALAALFPNVEAKDLGETREPQNNGGGTKVNASPGHYISGMQIGRDPDGQRWIRVHELPFRL